MSFIRSRKHRDLSTRLHPATAAVALLAIPTSIAAQTSPTPASAQTAPETLPEVTVRGTNNVPNKVDTVSSPKFTAPLINTPQTITVIPREVLREQGATSLHEALRNTPGVTLLLGEGGNSNTKDNIFMRGFDASGSIFTDGVRDLGSHVRDTFNTEQVEVLKGATGSEFGRGGFSGAINQSSKRPWLETFHEGSVALGTAGGKRATADLNRPIGENSAVRLNLMAQDSGVAGRNEVNNQGIAFAPSVAFGLNSPTRLIFSFIHAEQDNVPDGGVPTVGLPGYYNAGLANSGVNAQPVNPENFYGSRSDYARVKADQLTAQIEHDLSPTTTLRNTFRAGRSEFDQLITGPNATVSVGTGAAAVALPLASWSANRSRQLRRQVNELITNQTNLRSTLRLGNVEHTLSGGFELIYERQLTPTLTGAGTVTSGPDSLYNPNPDDAVVGQNVSATGARNDGNTLTLGLYAFDSIVLNEHWQVHAGVRADKYRVEANNVAVPATGSPTATTLSGSDTLLSWKLGTVFKPTPNGSVYASVSTAQTPPGGNNFTLNASSTNINNPNMDPSEATHLELGTKWEVLNQRLALTAALFDTTVKNDLVRDSNGFVEQYGKKKVRGIELGVVGQITPAWSLSAGLAKMKASVEQGTAAQTGAAMNWSPDLSLTTWTTYKLPFGLTVGGGARYMDSVVRSISNSATAATTNMLNVPSYWVFDAMANYEVSKNLSLQLNLYNLADKHYIAQLNNNGNRYTPGATRSGRLTAHLKF